ncbi:hypothetical protein NM208_g9709 [Fusarium decemcellulare]|uniref:Uncharacterized protein n=1 Tax=Fusarium decemcellulare TaxID=57161 RepID=A0ACC1S0S7_9HYPO|nr:hypothetical protein NM208_g9709 [Fusarium decemcellulare]
MVNFKNLVIVATTLIGCTSSAPTSPTNEVSDVSDIIPGSYIITLKPQIKPAKVKAHLNWVGDVHKRSLTKRDSDLGVEKTYDNKAGFHAYAGTFDPSTIKEIKKSSDVVHVEPDRRVTLSWNEDRPEEQHEDEPEDDQADQSQFDKRDEINQDTATWSLSAVSRRVKGFKNYYYDSGAGDDSYAYVVDSGVRVTHKEFQGRAKSVYTAFKRDNTDRLGHGTHILSVKVFQGNSADLSVILEGINWAVQDVINKDRQEFAVINLSLGVDGVSAAMNQVVENAAKAGVVCVVASGNSGKNTATTSPGSAKNVITVGAIDKNWSVASFSNWGPSVDIMAPGVDVTSASWKSDKGTYIQSGTSMAAPHVAGLVLYAQSVEGVVGVSKTTAWLKKVGTRNKISGKLRNAPNLIANNNNYLQ